MAADDAATRRELEQLEELIANVRASAAGIREQIGGGGQGPADTGDVSALVSEVQEQEAVLTGLEQRRDDLRRQLGLDEAAP